MLHSYNGMLSHREKEWESNSRYSMDEPWKYAKYEKPAQKSTYCMAASTGNEQVSPETAGRLVVVWGSSLLSQGGEQRDDS